jgi:hypothetical protein
MTLCPTPGGPRGTSLNNQERCAAARRFPGGKR